MVYMASGSWDIMRACVQMARRGRWLMVCGPDRKRRGDTSAWMSPPRLSRWRRTWSTTLKAMASRRVHMASPDPRMVMIPPRWRNVSYALEPKLARRLHAAGLALKKRLVRDMPRTRAVVLGLVRLLVRLLAQDLPLPPSRKLRLPLVGSRLMRPSYPFPVGLAGRLRPTGLDGVWAMVAPSLTEAQGARLGVHRCSPCYAPP